MQQLRRAVDEAGAGMGRLLLISGEPGVGKTSLATEALAEAERRGARTVTGVCWDGAGTPGLWPWIQVLRTLRSSVDPAAWERASGPGHDALDRLVEAEPLPTTPAVEFHVFDAVRQVLGGLATEHVPLAILIEDLQWADAASVQLLEFVQRHAGHLPLLLVATYRVDELSGPNHPRREAVADLAGNARAIALGGLDNQAIQQLRERLGVPTTLAEAEHLRRLTGGNPFFIIESTAYSSPIESLGVQRAIENRIDALGGFEREVLTVASIVGRTVPDALVVAVAGAEAADALATITRAGLMEAAPDTHAFVHDLVREAIASRLPIDERRSVHAAIVRAADLDEVAATLLPAQIAWQATQALPEIPTELAVDLLEAAAADASARLTHEAAGRQLAQAAALCRDPRQADRLTLQSGQAYLRAGELAQARDRFTSLLDQSPDVRARALLGLHALGEEAAGPESDVARGLDEVHQVLGPEADAALRAEVLAARSRARAHLLADDRSEARQMALDALELARAAEDDPTLASCLLAHHDAIWEPGTELARLALARELTEVGHRLHDSGAQAQGLLLTMVAELELGHPAFRHTHQRFDRLAEASRSPRLRYWAASRRGTVAMLDGDFTRAIEEIDAARDLGTRIGEPDAVSVWCDQRWQAARQTGDLGVVGEVSDVLRAHGDPHWVLYEALLGLDTGDVDRAERWTAEVEAISPRWPRWAARLWLTFLTQRAIGRDDPAAMATLIERLRPEAPWWAVLGGGVIVDGPMSLWLGRLEAARGDLEGAVAWFIQAEDAARRLGSRYWRLEASGDRLVAQHGLGTMGTTELTSTIEQADALGLAPLVGRLRPLGVAPPANVFRLDHDVWTLVWEGEEIRLPDAKGLRDLHTLLANPGTDVSVVDLASSGAVRVRSAAPVLDPAAKEAYRRRLDELDGAIDRAARRGQPERVTQFEAERVALIDELRRATGLGGRTRRLDDDGEKMRKTVTARIRDTLRKLDERHPSLAAHLRHSVRTGAHCSYRPVATVHWDL